MTPLWNPFLLQWRTMFPATWASLLVFSRSLWVSFKFLIFSFIAKKTGAMELEINIKLTFNILRFYKSASFSMLQFSLICDGMSILYVFSRKFDYPHSSLLDGIIDKKREVSPFYYCITECFNRIFFFFFFFFSFQIPKEYLMHRNPLGWVKKRKFAVFVERLKRVRPIMFNPFCFCEVQI